MDNKGVRIVTIGVVLILLVVSLILFFSTGKKEEPKIDDTEVINDDKTTKPEIDTRTINGWKVIDIQDTDSNAMKLQKRLYIEIARVIPSDYNFRFDSDGVVKFTFNQLKNLFKMDFSFMNEYASNCNLDNSYITFKNENTEITREVVLSCESFK